MIYGNHPNSPPGAGFPLLIAKVRTVNQTADVERKLHYGDSREPEGRR